MSPTHITSSTAASPVSITRSGTVADGLSTLEAAPNSVPIDGGGVITTLQGRRLLARAIDVDLAMVGSVSRSRLAEAAYLRFRAIKQGCGG